MISRSTIRTAIVSSLALVVASTTITSSAEARYRRHYGGAGLAFGIGSLVLGGIAANHYRRHYYSNSYYDPSSSYYSYGPRYYGWEWRRHHRHHRHWR